jgi:tRNA dimethylallyltransferase
VSFAGFDCACITGPTACGKTELAFELAERLPLEVVSMDSALVYRGLDIGTAKPSPEMRRVVPHHLIDIVEPNEAYSAGRFVRDAAATIGTIQARGRLPLLVGGTLLYLRALRDGLAALPRADRGVRAAIDAEAELHGWATLHKRLQRVDPEAAARVAPGDRQRIQRALEVYELTGRPISELQRAGTGSTGLNILTIALVPEDRAELGRRIELRFDAMVARGFVAEVERLKARGDLTPAMPAIRSVGYRQIWAFLSGETSWEEARNQAVIATRQYARRQLTWLRGDRRCEPWPAFGPHLDERLLERLEREGLVAAKKPRRLC